MFCIRLIKNTAHSGIRISPLVSAATTKYSVFSPYSPDRFRSPCSHLCKISCVFYKCVESMRLRRNIRARFFCFSSTRCLACRNQKRKKNEKKNRLSTRACTFFGQPERREGCQTHTTHWIREGACFREDWAPQCAHAYTPHSEHNRVHTLRKRTRALWPAYGGIHNLWAVQGAIHNLGQV